ncbi:MAG: sugar ABC transporter permease [Corallococcus sp.]|nr:sugar ABC transporter permease [Corallococcus sp.]
MVENKQQWKAWLYLSPALILLLVFTVYPIVNTVINAFNNTYTPSASDSASPIGFNNFIHLFKNGGFILGNCLKNTMLLCVLTVPISTMLALLIAVALNAIKPLQKLFQTIFFLPYVTNTIAIGMVFAVMFEVIGVDMMAPDGVTPAPLSIGVINAIIQAFTGKTDFINWIGPGSSYANNIFVLSVYIVWNALPFKILVLLGGLQGVNKQYYEAAKVDGTSRWRTFWRITVPMLSPMLAYVIITGFIGGFKEYSSVVGIFGDTMGPADAQEGENINTMVGLIYDFIGGGNYGVASAAALVLFAIIFVVTMLNMYVSKKKVHY